MANKREREKRNLNYLLNTYKKEKNGLLAFYIWSAAILAVAVLCYFFNWVYVYNSASGIEVKVSGFSFIAATLSGNYSSTDKIYGDMAVPFYYYAKQSCLNVGGVTLAAGILNVVSIAVLIAVIITKLHSLSYVSVISSLASFVLLIVAFVFALGMKNDDILSVYCGGNPKCSIESLAIIPALVTAAALVVQCFAALKLFKAQMQYLNKKNDLKNTRTK